MHVALLFDVLLSRSSLPPVDDAMASSTTGHYTQAQAQQKLRLLERKIAKADRKIDQRQRRGKVSSKSAFAKALVAAPTPKRSTPVSVSSNKNSKSSAGTSTRITTHRVRFVPFLLRKSGKRDQYMFEDVVHGTSAGPLSTSTDDDDEGEGEANNNNNSKGTSSKSGGKLLSKQKFLSKPVAAPPFGGTKAVSAFGAPAPAPAFGVSKGKSGKSGRSGKSGGGDGDGKEEKSDSVAEAGTLLIFSEGRSLSAKLTGSPVRKSGLIAPFRVRACVHACVSGCCLLLSFVVFCWCC